MKVNWDAAVEKNNKKMGIGALVRDHEEAVLAAMRAPRPYICDPIVVDIVAALVAITYIYERFGVVKGCHRR
jgi:hypothetical protein